MRLPGWRAALAAAAVAGLAVPALTATAASAGVQPGVPSQSQMSGHRHELRPEKFTIKIVNDNPGQVWARGPVHGWATDTEKTGTTAVFDFGRGNTVNVLHTDVSNLQPVIDNRACTATATASGHWLFDGGTGTYAKAFGFGQFRFKLFLVFKKHHGKCACKITAKTRPAYSLVLVRAWGKATAGHRHHHHRK